MPAVNRLAIPRFQLCGAAQLDLQPAPDQMMGNRKWMRPGKPVWMLPFQHQRRLSTIEPARVFQFRAVDDDIFIDCTRSAADHQRRRIRPRLGHVVIDVGAANSGFLEDLSTYRVLDGFGRFDESGESRIHAGKKLLLAAERNLVA